MPDFFPYATQSLLPLVMPFQAPLNLSSINTFYDISRVRQASALFDWAAGSKYAFLLTADYIFNETHSTVADILAASEVSIAAITQRSVNNAGWLCSVAVLFQNVQPILSVLPAVSVVFAEGIAPGNVLICYFKEVLNFPLIPNGMDFYLHPNSTQPGSAVGSGGWCAA